MDAAALIREVRRMAGLNPRECAGTLDVGAVVVVLATYLGVGDTRFDRLLELGRE